MCIRDRLYLPRTLKQIRWTGARDLSVDINWGKGNPQNIPNTNATGFVLRFNEGYWIAVRVDRENNSIIEAYNEKVNDPSSTPASTPSIPAPLPPTPSLPPSLTTDPSQSTSSTPSSAPSSTPSSAPVQPIVPAPSLPLAEALPSGWEVFREPSGRIYYGNPASKRVQYNWPTSGGAKNKKKPNRRSNRRSHRRKASHMRTCKK